MKLILVSLAFFFFFMHFGDALNPLLIYVYFYKYNINLSQCDCNICVLGNSNKKICLLLKYIYKINIYTSKFLN